MDNRTTIIVAVVALVVLIAGYIYWDSTNTGETTLENANPNAPALQEPDRPMTPGQAGQ